MVEMPPKPIPQEGNPPSELTPFQRNSLLALREIITDPLHTDLLSRFRFTFDARSKRGCLPESGRFYPEDSKGGSNIGLVRALQEPFDNAFGTSHEWIQERNAGDDMSTPVDDEFRAQLLDAAEQAVRLTGHYVGLESLQSNLVYHDRNPDELSKDELKTLLVNGLNVYWENTYAHGYSGDPW